MTGVPRGTCGDEYFSQLPCLGTGASCMFVGVMNGYDPYLEGIKICIFSWDFFWGPKVGLHRWRVLFHPKRSLLYSYDHFYVFSPPSFSYLRMWWQLKYFFNFHRLLGDDEPNLTHIFQMG